MALQVSAPTPSKPLTIALVGMPGSGKSTVGRQLARQLSMEFVDSDAAVEQQLGMPIRDWFALKGEDAFRDIEQSVLDALSQRHGCILATGGGSVLRPSNRNALHSRCHVFYLRSSPDDLYRRLRHDTQRPLLQVEDPLKRLRELYRERDPLYRRTAHFVVEAARPSVQALSSMVLMQLELAGLVPAAEGVPAQPGGPEDSSAKESRLP
jgi:shikimate kinase